MNELTLEQIISLATNTANIVMSAHANKQCLKREINAEEILEILPVSYTHLTLPTIA